MSHKSAHREMRDAVQEAYATGRAEALNDVRDWLGGLVEWKATPAEVEQAFVDRFMSADFVGERPKSNQGETE